jgi:hypothetical protein
MTAATGKPTDITIIELVDENTQQGHSLYSTVNHQGLLPEYPQSIKLRI